MKNTRRLSICSTSIVAFMAAAAVSPGVTYTVNLGDTALTVPAGSPAGGSVLKLGGGSVIITGAQTYAGATDINEGSLVISAVDGLGTTSSISINHIPVAGAVTTGVTQGVSSGQLVIAGTYAPQTFAFSVPINISGGGEGGNGVALLSVGTNTINGGIIASSTSGSRFGNTFGMTTINGYTIGGAQASTIQGNGNLTITGLTSTGTGTFDKTGAGTAILSGAATNTGIVQLTAGTVRISTAAELGTNTTATAINFNAGTLEIRNDASQNLGRGISIATNSGTLNLDRAVGGTGLNGTVTASVLGIAANRTFTLNSRNGYGLTITGASQSGGNNNNNYTNNGNGTFRIGGNVWNNNDGTARTLTITGAGDFQFDGNILAGTQANHVVTKAGAGTLTLNGAGSTYLGATNIQGGTVTTRRLAGGLGSTASTAAVNIGTAGTTGTLNYIGAAGSGAGETFTRAINLAGTTGGAVISANQTGSAASALVLTNITATGVGAKTLTLNGASALDNEISGAIPNTGTVATSLLKTESGTWVLSGANSYTGATTIANGTLKIKATTGASNVLADASTVTFNADGAQAAGGRLVLTGAPATITTETIGTVNPVLGHGTIAVQNGGATTTLAVSGLSATSGSIGASVNFEALTASDVVTLPGTVDTVARGNVYFNGANFAYIGAGNVLRAPNYGVDVVTATTATGPLTAALHNQITGSFSDAGGITIPTLKIAGSQTLTLTGTLTLNSGSATVGGILVDGGAAVIAQGTGGAITQGLGAGAPGGALVIRTNLVGDSLALQVPITNSTTQGLSKNGLGTLILSATNNQAGPTNINEGTIQLAAGGRLSAANQALSIRQGATLDLNAVSTGTAIGAFNGAGTVTNTGSAAATLTVGNNNGTGTFSGVIQNGANPISVVKQGTGGQTWSGLNTYTGTATINSTGIVTVPNLANIGAASGIGAGDATSDATNQASLVFGGTTGGISYTGSDSVSINRLFTFAGTGAGAGGRIQANGVNNATLVFNKTNPIFYTPAAATVAQTLTLGGASTGDNEIDLQLVNPGGVPSAVLSVTKADAGVWKLGNAGNTYSGATTIPSGRIIAEGNALSPNSPLVLTNGGVLETSGTFNRALAAAAVNGTGSVTWTAAGTNTGNGGFAASSNKLTVNIGPSAALTWGSGGFLTPSTAGVSANLILNSATALAEVEVQNSIDLGAVSRTIQVDDNGTTGTDYATLTGILSGAGGGITKTGAGTLYLLGANAYTGPTVLTTGQTFITTFGNSASTSSNLGAGVSGLSLNGGGLQYVGLGESSDRAITASASSAIESNGSGALILNGTFTNAGTTAKTLTIQGLNTDDNRLESLLSNAAGNPTAALSVTKGGGGTWTISNPGNTQTGTTTAGGGNLGIANDGALGTGTLSIGNGNIFADGAALVTDNPISLAQNATGGIVGVNSITMSGPVSVGAGGNSTVNNFLPAGQSLTITGTVTNSDTTANRALVLGGNGTTIISGVVQNDTSTNARTLGITLSSGTLVLGGASANTYTGNVTVNGGTLRLAGGSGNVLPDVGSVIVGNTVLPAVIDLNGQTETIAALTGTSTGAKSIDNSAGSAVTLTVGAADGAVNFNGSIGNSGAALSIVKTGTAAGVLSGSSISYSGTTTVQTGGSLAFTVADPAATSGITVAGGAGLSLINGVASTYSNLNTLTGVLNLGAGAGTTSLGLDIGASSDTLATLAAATAIGPVNFSFGSSGGVLPASITLLSAASGLTSGGATYAINGIVPGGYTYALVPSDTSVVLNATAGLGGNFEWTGDQSGSWATYNAGNTNWATPAGADTAATPGPLDTVVFSHTLTPPAGPTITTTLDLPFAINDLQFNGLPASSAGPRVNILPGTAGTLTINPASSADGIDLPDNGGVASISAPIVLAGTQTWSVGSVGSLRPELIVTGVLSGTGDLTKLGSGTATITGANTRTGRTAIDNGTLRINAEAALGANPGGLVANQLSINGGTLRSTAAFVIDDTNRGITIGGLGGVFDTAGGNITIGSTAAPTLNLIAGSGSLRKEGGNTLVINSANGATFSGATTINGGAVRAGSSTALGTGGTVSLINTGTILEVGDGVNLGNTISVSNTGNDKALRLLAGATSGQVSGPITVAEQTIGNFRLQSPAGGTFTVAGAITNADANSTSGVRVNEVAGQTGVLILSNSGNAYLGPTEVRGGTLRNGASEVIPNGSAVTVNAANAANPSATYDLAGNSETIASLTYGANASSTAAYVNTVTTGAGTLTLGGNVTTVANPGGSQVSTAVLAGNVAMAATRTFTVADATTVATDLLVSAAITGAGGLTKAGAGTMEMTGASSYGGVTTVNAGTLLVNGSITGSVTTAGGTLGGTGTVGAITATTGVVSPGGSIGTLTATSLNMSGTSSFKLEINPALAPNPTSTDLLTTTGPLTLALGGTPLNPSILGTDVTLPLGTRFTFITYSGGVTGVFSVSGLAKNDIDTNPGDTFFLGLNQYGIDYDTTNSVALVVVPEPGIAASLLGGFGMLVGLQRIRRRSDRKA